MQLFELQMPDPFRSWETLRITAKVPKEVWGLGFRILGLGLLIAAGWRYVRESFFNKGLLKKPMYAALAVKPPPDSVNVF